MLIAAVAEPVRHAKAADAMMAVHDDLPGLPGAEFTHPLRQFLHGNQHGPLNPGRGMLLGRAAVEEQSLAGARLLEHAAGLDGGDLERSDGQGASRVPAGRLRGKCPVSVRGVSPYPGRAGPALKHAYGHD